jgi:hypothetical protein
LETAFPQLEALGLKGTFYCEPAMLLENLPEWAHVLACGHELGNGTFHGAVLDDGSLPGWTMQMVEEDVSEARALIEDLFPEQKQHSFAFPWGMGLSDGLDVSPVVREVYSVVRTGMHGVNAASVDPQQILCVQCDGQDSHELVTVAGQAIESGSWVVFSFEGVGTGERSVDACAHRDLCLYLANEPRLTVRPVCDVATSPAPLRAEAYKLV